MHDPPSRLLSAAGLVRLLAIDGKAPHPSLAYRLFKRGEIPALLIRGKLRFEAAAVEAYLERCAAAAETMRQPARLA